MNMLLPALLLGTVLVAQPLQVVGVLRTGMPPFEETERLYRLEGEGCQVLGVNELLTLRRQGERRNLGRLQIMAIKDGYALARLAVSGETYPLKGDLAVRHERVVALPALPPRQPEAAFPAEALAPRLPKLAIPASLAKDGLCRESIFFLKGSAELSPAAGVKLRAWVGAWGLDGRWALLVPAGPEPEISRARVEALRAALKGLGVMDLELRTLSTEPNARYDSISVSKEPW